MSEIVLKVQYIISKVQLPVQALSATLSAFVRLNGYPPSSSLMDLAVADLITLQLGVTPSPPCSPIIGFIRILKQPLCGSRGRGVSLRQSCRFEGDVEKNMVFHDSEQIKRKRVLTATGDDFIGAFGMRQRGKANSVENNHWAP